MSWQQTLEALLGFIGRDVFVSVVPVYVRPEIPADKESALTLRGVMTRAVELAPEELTFSIGEAGAILQLRERSFDNACWEDSVLVIEAAGVGLCVHEADEEEGPSAT